MVGGGRPVRRAAGLISFRNRRVGPMKRPNRYCNNRPRWPQNPSRPPLPDRSSRGAPDIAPTKKGHSQEWPLLLPPGIFSDGRAHVHGRGRGNGRGGVPGLAIRGGRNSGRHRNTPAPGKRRAARHKPVQDGNTPVGAVRRTPAPGPRRRVRGRRRLERRSRYQRPRGPGRRWKSADPRHRHLQ